MLDMYDESVVARQQRLPSVEITLDAWQHLMAYVKAAENVEICGYGLVTELGNVIRIDRVIVPYQVTSAVHAQVDAEVAAQLMYELGQAGEDVSRLRVQWHSHIGQAYFSPIDMAGYDDGIGDWFVHLVVNWRGDYACRIDYYTPHRVGMRVPLRVVYPELPEDVHARCCAEVQEKLGRASDEAAATFRTSALLATSETMQRSGGRSGLFESD